MTRPDLEHELAELYQRADRPELFAVRQALGLALRAVALGDSPRGRRARELLAEAHRAAMGAPAPAGPALVASARLELAVRPRRAFSSSPIGATLAREP